jgi:transketolase
MTPEHELQPVAEAMAHFAMSADYHVGGSLSPVDFLTALYFGGGHRLDVGWRGRPDRDKYVHSKGHTAAGQWFALWLHGYLGDVPLAELVTFGSFGHRLPRIPQRDVGLGIEMTTGSLGQGLSYGNGLALADRRAGRDAHTAVLLGDAECGEGQVWEAAQSTVRLGLANVTVAVDANGFGSHLGTDRDRLPAMWAGFGWAVTEVDGHDLAAVGAALQAARGSDAPTAVVLRTEKAHRLLPPYPGTFRAGGSVPPEFRPAYDLAAESALAAAVVARRFPGAAAARNRPRPPAGTTAGPAGTTAGPAGPLPWDAARHRRGDVVGTKSFALELTEHVQPGGDLFVASPDAIRNSGLMPLLAGHGSWTWANPRSAVLEHPIAEADLGSLAAGATANGLRTVVFLMEGFVWRMLDSLRQSICFPGLPVVVVGTSAGVGEDLGPMAQSDACFAAVTALPGLTVFEACDVNEAKVLLDEALAEPGPAYLRLPTEALPVAADLAEVRARDSRDGAWVLRECPEPELVLLSAGSLVPTALATADRLAAEEIGVRVVAVCSTTRLGRAPAHRRDRILPPGVPVVSVHNAPASVLGALLPAGSTSLGLTDYGGYGGPPERLYEAAGLGPAHVLAAARQALARGTRPDRPVAAGVGDGG